MEEKRNNFSVYGFGHLDWISSDLKENKIEQIKKFENFIFFAFHSTNLTYFAIDKEGKVFKWKIHEDPENISFKKRIIKVK